MLKNNIANGGITNTMVAPLPIGESKYSSVINIQYHSGRIFNHFYKYDSYVSGAEITDTPE